MTAWISPGAEESGGRVWAAPEFWSYTGSGGEGLGAIGRHGASNGTFLIRFTKRIAVVLGRRLNLYFGVQPGAAGMEWVPLGDM